MSKIITIEDVKIKTMQVEIKALTINGKQVTLSLFRQLPYKRLWTTRCNLAGVPWGWINYQNEDDFKHYVWQSGNELCKDKIRPPSSSQARKEMTDTEYRLLNDYESSRDYVKSNPSGHWNHSKERFTKAGEFIKANEEEYKRLVSIEKKVLENMKRNYETIKQLPQLFIAA